MKRSLALTSLLLSAGLISTSAQSAEEVNADRVTGLNEIGVISVNDISGTPQEIEKVIAHKADEQGAAYYRIIQMHENQRADNWHVQAIIYS
ncbi:DUF1471 domain-containing protein [Cronobacter sakazakii]|uniref:DUF1471 domain-containing protein n=1 Tax=Cronobacter sakazakii TaxID=28141 RepID=UPI000BE88D40|nr:DUF1471 domain-containing protein [Cronobacter sakazakii]ELY3803829.1 DUF1471 domain-containing protein [Cronobacter sakazakii]MDT3519649.1 DUF1471 domain-containing protein [Cronobacter sakazakii]PUV45464.1 DUF1471 domain-containing protein [Cronobacter sakazakii]TWR38188.1 DUF1471 domain-containing protein [Cronobacter sakazakii]